MATAVSTYERILAEFPQTEDCEYGSGVCCGINYRTERMKQSSDLGVLVFADENGRDSDACSLHVVEVGASSDDISHAVEQALSRVNDKLERDGMKKIRMASNG